MVKIIKKSLIIFGDHIFMALGGVCCYGIIFAFFAGSVNLCLLFVLILVLLFVLFSLYIKIDDRPEKELSEEAKLWFYDNPYMGISNESGHIITKNEWI